MSKKLPVSTPPVIMISAKSSGRRRRCGRISRFFLHPFSNELCVCPWSFSPFVRPDLVASMKSTTVSTAVESDHQELYVRTRDDPFFAGMRRDEIAIMRKGSAIGLQEKLARKNKFRSVSDIGTRGSRNMSINISEEASLSPKDSPFDIVLTPIGRSLTGRWSKTSSPLVVVQSDLNTNFHDLNEPSTVSSPDSREGKEGRGGFMGPTIQSSHYVSKRQTDISDIPLPPSAALFYNGPSQQMEVTQSCEGVYKLNMYLKARRTEVNAGVPGKFLHAIIGPDVADVGSVASTIMYAFYLYDTLKSKQFCTVPVINMKRTDLDSHADVHWILDSCHIDLSSLIFIDEIDLSYYNLFGCLKLVLINCDKIPSEQEALREAIVEVFHCTKSDIYSRVGSITLRQDVSCCTVIAEKFANGSPEILAGQGFSRLLLAGILMDSGNLSNSHCTSKDKYMATLLINGAGRFGFSGLHQILKYKTSSSSNLKVKDILQKEFKKWTISGIGMSSIGMSIAQLLSHDSASIQEIILFQKQEALGLLLVVSGYYDSRKKFKREILISAESSQLMKNLLHFLDSSETHQLPLKAIHQSGLKDEMRVFEVDKVTSRRTIELLLEDYISASNTS